MSAVETGRLDCAPKDVIDKILGLADRYGELMLAADDKALSGVTVSAANANTVYWGHKVSTLQTSISIANGAITGTLKYVSSGALANDWGAGNFIALVFSSPDEEATSVKVGMEPSMGSGLQELDSDMDAVLKVTDKDNQKVVVVSSDGSRHTKQVFDLSGLTCNTE